MLGTLSQLLTVGLAAAGPIASTVALCLRGAGILAAGLLSLR